MTPTDRNPFVAHRPLVPAAVGGRAAEIAQVTEAAGRGPCAILAPRGYGKTSLALALVATVRDADTPALYVEARAVASLEHLARRLEEAYRTQLPEASAAAALLDVWDDGRADRRRDRVLDLPRRLFERTGQRLVLVLDDAEDALSADAQAARALRERIALHRHEAAYVLVSCEPSAAADLAGTDVVTIDLPTLATERLAAVVTHGFSQTEREIGDPLAGLLEVTRGHPQRSMLVARRLWERTPRGERATTDALTSALTRIDNDLRESFDRLWQGLNALEGQRRVLIALGAPDGRVLDGDVRARFGLTADAAHAGIAGLRSRGDVVADADGRWVISDPMLERWVAARA